MKITPIAILVCSLSLAACSESPEPKAKDDKPSHVWSDQVEAYDTAKDVAGMVNQNLGQQEERLRAVEIER